MIESISGNGALLSTVSSQYAPEATAGSSESSRPQEKTPQQNTSGAVKAVYGNRDTVEISAAGAAYAKQAAAAKADQDGAEVTTAKVNDSAVTSAAEVSTDTAAKGTSTVVTQEATKTETTEAEESAGLSGYTDSELKQMMYKGEITQSEYDEEILSRNGYTSESEE